jgi:hypothetical protein
MADEEQIADAIQRAQEGHRAAEGRLFGLLSDLFLLDSLDDDALAATALGDADGTDDSASDARAPDAPSVGAPSVNAPTANTSAYPMLCKPIKIGVTVYSLVFENGFLFNWLFHLCKDHAHATHGQPTDQAHRARLDESALARVALAPKLANLRRHRGGAVALDSALLVGLLARRRLVVLLARRRLVVVVGGGGGGVRVVGVRKRLDASAARCQWARGDKRITFASRKPDGGQTIAT